MKLYFAKQADAQAAADKAHADLIACDKAYAESVKAGLTKAWSVPYESDGQWAIDVDSRVSKSFPDVDFEALAAAQA